MGPAPVLPGISDRFSKPYQPLSRRRHHKLVPSDARTHPHQDALVRVSNFGHPVDAHLQHQARQIAGEQHIAAPAQHMERTIVVPGATPRLP